MKIYRYYCEATYNYPEEGFISRLGSIGNAMGDTVFEEIYCLVKDFNDNLPYPDNEITLEFMRKNIPMICWFTTYGKESFKDTINTCINYLKENYDIEVRYIEYDISKDSNIILYQDKYQVVIGEEHYKVIKFLINNAMELKYNQNCKSEEERLKLIKGIMNTVYGITGINKKAE